jgi:DNA-binding NtrC family response regulator
MPVNNNEVMEPMVKYKRTGKKPAHEAVIFIVDDDVSYLHPLVFHLQRGVQYKIYCYTNGEECLRNMHLKPSIVILDYNLNPQLPNKLNGLDVLRQIKNMNPKTKVVMLSGRDEYKGVVDSLKLGAYTYVLKDAEALVAIKKILHTLQNEGGEGTDAITDTV